MYQRVGPAAGAAGDADALRVDFGAGAEVVEGADAVPGFDAGRRVAAGMPATTCPGGRVPWWMPVDLAEFEGVDDEADVAVAGEPVAVMLVGDLVAVADAVLCHVAVAADVEDGRRGAGDGSWAGRGWR